MKEFLEIYQKLNAENLDLLGRIYTPEIHFIDPAHEIRGLPQLEVYFKALYANITQIHFDFLPPFSNETEGYVQWQMTFSHPRLNGGESITVPGTSFVKFDIDGKVFFHRDYFDLGAMVYQHVPVLGSLVSYINERLGS